VNRTASVTILVGFITLPLKLHFIRLNLYSKSKKSFDERYARYIINPESRACESDMAILKPLQLFNMYILFYNIFLQIDVTCI